MSTFEDFFHILIKWRTREHFNVREKPLCRNETNEMNPLKTSPKPSELIQKLKKIVFDSSRVKKKQLSEVAVDLDASIFNILNDHYDITKCSE